MDRRPGFAVRLYVLMHVLAWSMLLHEDDAFSRGTRHVLDFTSCEKTERDCAILRAAHSADGVDRKQARLSDSGSKCFDGICVNRRRERLPDVCGEAEGTQQGAVEAATVRRQRRQRFGRCAAGILDTW